MPHSVNNKRKTKEHVQELFPFFVKENLWKPIGVYTEIVKLTTSTKQNGKAKNDS